MKFHCQPKSDNRQNDFYIQVLNLFVTTNLNHIEEASRSSESFEDEELLENGARASLVLLRSIAGGKDY